MSLSPYVKVRERIQSVDDIEVQMFLKALYLLGAARPVEIAAERCSGEKREIIYGPKGTDVWLEEIDPPNPSILQIYRLYLERNEAAIKQLIENLLTQTIQVAVFKIKNSRSKPKLNEAHPFRLVVLPMPEKYEPWTKGLYEYFRQAGNNYVFPKNRQAIWHVVNKDAVFENLKYPVKGYSSSRKTVDGQKTLTFNVSAHYRDLKMEGLRAVRVDELREKYGFDDLDLAVLVGSKISITRIPEMFESSAVKEDWHRYIKKLCKQE